MKREEDNFIMLPKVDFCFKELMQNPKVRKGFVAALLKVHPGQIQETTLLPTSLQRASEEDKLGILDVRVLLEDEECYRTIHLRDDKTGEVYTDLIEVQILELKKLPFMKEGALDIIDWMRFLGGKSREEFEAVAKTSEYLDEAYHTLVRLSADEEKRFEYEAREKALKDYNTQMQSAERRGEERAEKLVKQVFQLYMQGKQTKEISEICGISEKKVRELLE